jgi:hypothetical protein
LQQLFTVLKSHTVAATAYQQFCAGHQPSLPSTPSNLLAWSFLCSEAGSLPWGFEVTVTSNLVLIIDF